MGRVEALRDLVEVRVPVAEALDRLAGFPWDSDEDLVILGMHHVRHVLGLFRDGRLTASEVEVWADGLEVRDDVGRDPVEGDLISDALHRLATPELCGPVEQTVDELADRLGIEPRVTVDLSYDEAIVLLDWLSRMSATDAYEVEDQAEERVLWDLEAVLERKIVEMHADDYQPRLRAARERVRDAEE